MMEVSFFEKVSAYASTKNLYDLLDSIRSGRYAVKVSKLRTLVENNDESKDSFKRSLPSFTPSGVFCKSHKKDDLQSYNPLIVLDIDKVGIDKANELKQKVSEIDATFAAFISPSGDGLKILVKCDSTAETHESIYHQVAAFYESQLNVPIDQSGKDFSRLCFLSYDPDLYLNDHSAVWTSTSTELPIFSTRSVSVSTTELFNRAVQLTEEKYQYVVNYRNHYLFNLINNLNRFGVSQDEAYSFVRERYSDPDMVGEIDRIFRRVYSNTVDHGKYSHEYHLTATTATTAPHTNTIPKVQTPLIPDTVYRQLPTFLNKVVKVFEVERERDIVLTSALTLLSGCFNNVTGIYDRREYHPNLFCFIIAPAASGKGVMIYCRQLIQRIHSQITDAYKEMEAKSIDLPDLQWCLIIPADISAAALKKMIMMNNEKGIICETEADTLSATWKQDWGGYSELLRQSFHHEPVTVARLAKVQPPFYAKSPKESPVSLDEIKHPQLSVCLSGTPSQVPALLKSTEDGLFSRFMFYSFNEVNSEFKDVFAVHDVVNLSEYFDELSQKMVEYYNRVNEYGPILFDLNKQQKDRFLNVFNQRSKKLSDIFGDETKSTVNRLGLITFRLAMVLTILRQLDNNTLSSEMVCEDVDFESSIQLSEVYLDHALDVYQKLNVKRGIGSNPERLYNALPDEFKYSDAEKVAISIGMGKRSVNDYLKVLMKGQYLAKDGMKGKYNKRELQQLQ